MKSGVVIGPPPERLEFRLKLWKEVKSTKDVYFYPDWIGNVENALVRKDPIELYGIYREGTLKPIAHLLWFPSLYRGGVGWEHDEKEEWTNAANELEVLERLVWGEMTDTIEEEEAYEGEQLEIEAEEAEEEED